MSAVGQGYILSTGEAGASRLAMLSRVFQPTTSAFLARVGIERGMRCLDVGCGSGEVTELIADLVGGDNVVGMDRDPSIIEIATARVAGHRGRVRPRFVVADADELGPIGEFDLVYSRFLLSHLRDPLAVLRSLVSHCRAGATIAVEDVDFAGHVCEPRSWAFDRFVELYQLAARANGADPCIGPALPDLFRAAGLVDVKDAAVLPLFTEGEGKLVAQRTFEQLRPALLALGLADESELSAIQRRLEALGTDRTTTMSVARTVQVVGRTPSP